MNIQKIVCKMLFGPYTPGFAPRLFAEIERFALDEWLGPTVRWKAMTFAAHEIQSRARRQYDDFMDHVRDLARRNIAKSEGTQQDAYDPATAVQDFVSRLLADPEKYQLEHILGKPAAPKGADV